VLLLLNHHPGLTAPFRFSCLPTTTFIHHGWVISQTTAKLAAAFISFSGISLWLVPPTSVIHKLERIMHVRPLTTLLSSPSSWPRFTPHVTLGSAPTLEAARAAVPEDQQPVPVRFAELQAGEHYFRSVLVAVHLDEPLDTLERRIREAVGRKDPPPSYPHMSFAYIDDAEAGQRERIRDEMLQNGIAKNVDGGVVLKCGESEEDVIRGYQGTEIWVVLAEGKVEDWEVLDKIRLKE
jgi:2',3'-cyclic-nucleotide 3'-phosphodiesterase